MEAVGIEPAEFSVQTRRIAINASPPKKVDARERIELTISGLQPEALPLGYRAMVVPLGFEPRPNSLKGRDAVHYIMRPWCTERGSNPRLCLGKAVFYR